MPKGRGDGQGEVGAKIVAMEQQLRDLRRQAGIGNGGGAARGGLGKGGGGDAGRDFGAGGGGRNVLRPGDWVCSSCGARPCWARTVSCFRCGEPRPRGGAASGWQGPTKGAAAVTRKEEYLGPRGANGSRPMLGKRADPPPTSSHGRTQQPGAVAARSNAPADTDVARRRKPPAADADGFREVSRQTWPKVGSAPRTANSTVAPKADAPTSWAELVQRAPGPRAVTAACADGEAMDANEDGYMVLDDDGGPRRTTDGDCSDLDSQDGDCGAGEEDEVDDEGAIMEEETTEEDLRRIWEDSKEACKVLERNPRTPSSIVAAARKEREQAEARWRASKRPHPLHKRMRWAQRAYDSAVVKQQSNQLEFDNFEQEAARKRHTFLERAQVDRARTARKLRALEEVLEQSGQRALPQAERAARIAATGIADELGPALAAVAEKLSDASLAWAELQAAMATLATVEDVLLGAVREQPPLTENGYPVQYDISDGPVKASSAQATADGDTGRTSSADKSPGGGNATQPPTADPAQTTTATGRQTAAKAATTKWRGPRAGDSRWGGQAWCKQQDGPGVAAPGASWNSAGGGGAAGSLEGAPASSATAKEQAEKLLEQRANLLAAQAKEREAAEAARVQSAEVARLQQLQQEQQRQAMADAAAAAEALRQAQRAMAEAEAQEAARQEMERQALVARTSPEELRRAQVLHAQQAAIAAAGFGTAQAAAGAEMLQAAAPPAQAQGTGGIGDDAEHIMGMSPEELAEAQRGSMDVGQCPW